MLKTLAGNTTTRLRSRATRVRNATRKSENAPGLMNPASSTNCDVLYSSGSFCFSSDARFSTAVSSASC